jgi:uncharacterized membrane protein YfcA
MSEIFLIGAVAVAAALYASVGHGGASAYLAILTFAGRVRPEIASTVLVMNILVSTLAWVRFQRRGHFDAPLTGALLLFSAPAAFAGGIVSTSPRQFSILLGLALVAASARLLLPDPRPRTPRRPEGGSLWSAAALLGVSLGLLAGLTGVGGGIYLSPLLILLGWKDTKGTAGISSAFISINSLTSLLGRVLRGESFNQSLLPLVFAALLGGFLGSWWGADRAAPLTLRRLLGIVLVIAGIKLLFAWQ